MKNKLLVVLLAAISCLTLVFGLSACGNKGDNTGDDKKEHSHDYTSNVVLPTCTEQGYTEYICSCGSSYKDNYIPAKGHTVVKDEAISPTCSQTGLTEGSHCSVCGEVLVAQAVINTTEHNYGEWLISAECGSTESYTIRYCLDCKHVDYIQGDVVIHPHSYFYVGSKEPTCTESGYSAMFRCENCGYEVKDEIAPLGHLEGTTCYEEEEYHYYFCTRDNCGAKVNKSHNYRNYEIISNPTCTAAGQQKATCSVCGHVGYFDIPARHTYDSGTITVAPTCTQTGVKVYHCVYCDESLTQVIPALGHNYGKWTVTKEANCTEEGERIRTCSRCGETDTQIIPKKHTWGDWVITKEATCTENGEQKHECTLCGAVETSVIYAHHKWDEGLITTEPTCTENGVVLYTCTVCGAVKNGDEPALGHDYCTSETVEPTCTEAGYTVETCSRCGDVVYTGVPL